MRKDIAIGMGMLMAIFTLLAISIETGQSSAQDVNWSPPTQIIQSLPVASLPACTASNNGVVYRVTDALMPVILSLIVGGGTVNVLVECKAGTGFIAG